MSVMGFLAQLENPPKLALAAETTALRKSAPGPGVWIIPEDCWFLKEQLGQTKSFVSLRFLCLASQLRVAHHENWSRASRATLAQSQSSFRRRSEELEYLINSAVQADRRHHWGDWYARSHILRLYSNKIDLAKVGITIGSISSAIISKSLEEDEKHKHKQQD